jgi:uncharacterized protein (TIGR03435 family)
MTAYDVKGYQITGPAWLASERYDIAAKVPAGATKEQVDVMWQNLLLERFGVRLHHESKEFKVEELVVAKGGPKLKEPAQDPTAPLPPGPPDFKDGQLRSPGLVTTLSVNGHAHAFAKAQPLSKLTEMLSNTLHRPVLDKTGLTGKYDFDIEFRLDLNGLQLPGPPPGLPGAGTAAPPGENASDPGQDLAAAVEQQLGLRLVASTAMLDVLIIDKAEKVPTDN